MMKKFVVAVMVLALCGAANAGLYWGSGNGVIDDYDGDPVATTDSFDPTAGAFAQLIRILTGSSPSAFVNSGSGISGTDVVISTMYSGQHDDLSDPGTFALNLSAAILNDAAYNGYYYVRVFDAPQATLAAWNQGTNAPIPTGASYYFQSGTYNYTHNELEPSTFNFGSGQTLNPIAIPEPTTMILMVGGFAGVMAIRRKRA